MTLPVISDWFDFIIQTDNAPGAIHAASNGIYHNGLLKTLRFPLFKYMEDSPFMSRLYYAAKDSKFAFISNPLYFYYQSPASITRPVDPIDKLAKYEALRWLLDYWENKDEPEIYDCYFKCYFTKLVTDYTELRRDLPAQQDRYEHLAAMIGGALRKACDMNLKVLRLPVNARELYNELLESNDRIILQGYGILCLEIMQWLNYYGIKVFEVWDYDTVDCDTAGRFGAVEVKSPRCDVPEKDTVRIIFAVDNENAQTRLRRKLRKLGYNKFMSCDSVFGAIKFARYRDFLPALLGDMCCE
jgi:hypothetical protein